MRIGFDHYTISDRKLAPEATLEFAATHGLRGVQFLEPAAIDRELAPARLKAIEAQARASGLYLEVGLPSPNPVRRSRELGRSVSAKQHAADLGRHVRAVAALGCDHARVYVGDRHDRFRTDHPWEEQRRLTLETLEHLAPCLRDCGVRAAIETHADLTVDELLALVEHLGPDVAAVTLDTGNLAMRLDDPLEAVERLAPWVVCTHVKDCVLAFTSRGLCWQARPVGSGILPIPDMVAVLHRANPMLNLSIELHPRTYDLPIFDRSWLSYFPGLRPDQLAAVVRLAALCELRFDAGALPRPPEIEAVPWLERDMDWLARSLGFLKPVVEMAERVGDGH